MNKDELIKFLLEQSNNLKLINNRINNNEKSLEEIGNEFGVLSAKVISLLYADFFLVNALIEYYNRNSDGMKHDALFATLGIFIYLLLKSKYTTDKEVVHYDYKKDNYNEIDKIQKSIEFLKSLSKEEEMKYLLK